MNKRLLENAEAPGVVPDSVEVITGQEDFQTVIQGSESKPFGEDARIEADLPFYFFENVVTPEEQENIENTLLNSVEWYWNENTNHAPSLEHHNVRESGQFVHNIFESKFKPLTDNILKNIQEQTNLEIEEIVRIKANMLLPQPGWKHCNFHPPHVDVNDTTGDNTPYVSMIYYANDSDGDTYFFNTQFGEDVQESVIVGQMNPKRGRLVVLNSNRYHASSCPVTSANRLVINFVLKVRQ